MTNCQPHSIIFQQVHMRACPTIEPEQKPRNIQATASPVILTSFEAIASTFSWKAFTAHCLSEVCYLNKLSASPSQKRFHQQLAFHHSYPCHLCARSWGRSVSLGSATYSSLQGSVSKRATDHECSCNAARSKHGLAWIVSRGLRTPRLGSNYPSFSSGFTLLILPF